MCLLLGPSGVGKTLLLKRLHSCSNRGSYSNVGDAPSTIPTVGTNLVNVAMTKKSEVTIRELGGCMAPIWHNYFNECNMVMFMVDISNRQQVSSACIQLMEIMNNDMIKDSSLLIILNKVDIDGGMDRMELDSIMRLTELKKFAQQTISILDVSARDGSGIHEVAKWVQEHSKH